MNKDPWFKPSLVVGFLMTSPTVFSVLVNNMIDSISQMDGKSLQTSHHFQGDTPFLHVMTIVGAVIMVASIIMKLMASTLRRIDARRPSNMLTTSATSHALSSSTTASTVPEVKEVREKATKLYDDIRDSFSTKIASIDYQLDHPDLFRTDFKPAAKFYEQFEDTKTLASLSNHKPTDLKLAQKFLKAAKTSDTLWGEAVAASSISLQDGSTSLSSTDKAVLKRVHGTIALAADKAIPEDTRENHWEWVAKLLAQLNMNAMHPEARMALKRAIREPELSITTGHIPNLPELDAA